MRSINIKDFSIKDFSKITSEFISDVFKNFVDNFLYLVQSLIKLNQKHENYKTVSDKTFEFLYSDLATITDDTRDLKAYNAVIDSSNVNHDRAFGTISLAEVEKVELISKVDRAVPPEIANIADDDAGTIALYSSRIYKLDPINPEQIIEDETLRRIIDETGYVWYEQTTDDTMTIVMQLPDTDSRISYVELFPYAGTQVTEVIFKRDNDAETSINIAGNDPEGIQALIRDGFPLKLHVNLEDFTNEIHFKLAGMAVGGGEYFYSIGYIKAWIVTSFADTGYVTYDLEAGGTDPISTITDIDLKTPYIYPTSLVDEFPIDIKVFDSANPGAPEYDTSTGDPYPLESDIDVSSFTGQAYITFTLKNTNDISPVFRRCVVTAT